MDTTRTALWSRKLASALAIFLLLVFTLVPQAWADTVTAHPSTNGALAVEDGKLIYEICNEPNGITAGLDLRPEISWRWFALGALSLVALSLLAGTCMRHRKRRGRTYEDLLRLGDNPQPSKVNPKRALACQSAILASAFFTLVYLCWRMLYSIPVKWGWLAVACNVALLLVEILGFAESLVHFRDVAGMRTRPLPVCAPEEYPDVDIFIATYNEPDYLLAKTINGCKHLEYPDPSKVHVWLCDDNRRPEMRALAERMGIGYFDRPDNKGAKAGNLNAAMARTSAPVVVTLDADMIVQRSFLMQTIPYFIDSERRNADLPADQQIKLGLLQTPQCFHNPDVFQHGLYAENSIPNEQDYFYRTVEVAKTSSNSVIYGGSNTVLAREALEAVGGFYTESITEDFATGLLIESAGYVSLALPTPLASGTTPHTFAEHIKQRTRWGRGVIATARKLGITLSTFKVTDKSGPATRRATDWRSLAPFIVLAALSVLGITRVTWLLGQTPSIGFLVLLFWLVRNLYFLSMSLFLADGRDSDGENVKVKGLELTQIKLLEGVGTTSGPAPGTVYEGVTTLLTEHNASVFLDNAQDLRLGSQVELAIDREPYHVEVKGVVTKVTLSRNATQSVHTVEILDFGEEWGEYLQILYDRVPTLPQRLTHDPGPVRYFWRNLAARLGRTS